tara:strand:- start:250 stop:528 length:279 start_codon:yes stop_codon:yes gene_type:complete
MGKKNKKIKKIKTKEQREQEITVIINKLSSIGLTSNNPDIQEAIQRMNEYIETGQSFTGKIKINGFKRILQLILSKRPHIQSTACLKYNENI